MNHVAFSPDGRTLPFSGSDGAIRLWSVDNGRGYGVTYRRLAANDSEVSKLASASIPAAGAARKIQYWHVLPAQPAVGRRIFIGTQGNPMRQFNEIQRKWVDDILRVIGRGRSDSPGVSSPTVMAGSYVNDQLGKAIEATRPKMPSSKDAVKKIAGEPDWDEIERKRNTPPPSVTNVGPNKQIVQQGDGRLSPDVEYEKLEDGLKAKLSHPLWGGLKKQQRWTLIETYRRMSAHGLWDQVKRVIGEKDQPEPHVAFGGFEFQVAGNSGGIVFEAVSGDGLVNKLKGTSHFGEDGSVIGALHKGQRSMREWGESTSLHISVGPGNKFDAHIDKVSPTSKPVGGKTRIDPVKGKGHHTTEVWPEKIRDKTGIPGVIVEGTIDENKEGWHGGELKVGVKIELRGPVEKKKVDIAGTKPKSSNPVAKDVMEKIAKRVQRTKNYFPISIGTAPDDVPLPEAVAAELAAEMMEAVRQGKTLIQLNVPYYLDHQVDQPAALTMMREIGTIVRSELGPPAASVKGLTVTFGSKKQSRTVSLGD